MKKLWRGISTVLLSVCVGGMSVMAVSDAVCEHPSATEDYYQELIRVEEFGHVYYYNRTTICEVCGQALSSEDGTHSESHDYKTVDIKSEEQYDGVYHSTVYTVTQRCSVCAYTNRYSYEVIH